MKSDYLKYRRLGKELSSRIMKTVAKHELEAAAHSLQMIHKGVMVFDSEEEAGMLMDRAFYDIPRGARNVVTDFYLSRSPEEFTPDERRVLEAKTKAWFSLFQIESIDAGASAIFLSDLINNSGPFKLIDINLSASGSSNFLLATRLLPFGDWCMTSGISYPFEAKQAQELLGGLKRRVLGSAKKKYRTIPPEDYSRYFFLQFKAQSEIETRYEDV